LREFLDLDFMEIPAVLRKSSRFKEGLGGIWLAKMAGVTPALTIILKCHSEGSEESRFFKDLRSFTSFRMTKERVLQQF
jgi:hypothetical protein